MVCGDNNTVFSMGQFLSSSRDKSISIVRHKSLPKKILYIFFTKEGIICQDWLSMLEPALLDVLLTEGCESHTQNESNARFEIKRSPELKERNSHWAHL